MVSSIVYLSYRTIKNLRDNGVCWVNQGLIKDGQLVWKNLFGFILYGLLYFITQCMIFLTLWFSRLATINVGIIMVLWALTPLLSALADFAVFGQKLYYYHIVGMVLCVLFALVLSL